VVRRYHNLTLENNQMTDAWKAEIDDGNVL
jgi:hypothetical protein